MMSKLNTTLRILTIILSLATLNPLQAVHNPPTHAVKHNKKLLKKSFIVVGATSLSIIFINALIYNLPKNNTLTNHANQKPPSEKSKKYKPCGLTNEGNTCFINATLQCLAQVPAIQNYFNTNTYKKDLIKEPNKYQQQIKTTKAFARMIKKMHENSNKENFLYTDKFIQAIRNNPSFEEFEPNQQHDSYDFLNVLLYNLKQSLNKKEETSLQKKSIGMEPDTNNVNEHDTKKIFTEIDEICGGIKLRITSCPTCGKDNSACDLFLDIYLLLDDTNQALTDLDALLEAKKQERKIPDLECRKCHKIVTATYREEFKFLPNLLILRFNKVSKWYKEKKIDRMVTFPLKDLLIKVFKKGQDNKEQVSKRYSKTYDLIGVVNHHGPNIKYGHYTAYVMSSQDQHWYHLDDRRVTLISDTNQVVTKDAYVLFYQAQDRHPANVG